MSLRALGCFFLLLACMLGNTEPASQVPTPSGGTGWESLFDGQTLKGWKVLKELNFDQAGKVEVQDGCIVLGEGGPYTGITWEGDFPRENFEVEWEGMRPEGTDIFCGLTVPVGSDHITFVPGGWSNSLVGLSNVDDMNASENMSSKGMSFENKRWYKFCVRVTSERIQVSIDGKEVIHQEREGHTFSIYSQLEPNRPVGFFSWYTTGHLRSLRMRRL